MGGSIGFGVRFEHLKKGMREVFMDRWTNDLFWRIASHNFVNAGFELAKLIREAKPTNSWPKSQLLDTIVPGEYGIVLVDFPSREVFDSNDYSCAMWLRISRHSTAFNDELNNACNLAIQGKLSRVVINEFSDNPGEVTPEVFVAECMKMQPLANAIVEERRALNATKRRPSSMPMKDLWEAERVLDDREQRVFKFFDGGMHAEIKDEVFRVFRGGDRRPNSTVLKAWLDAHGWVTPMGEWEDDREWSHTIAKDATILTYEKPEG